MSRFIVFDETPNRYNNRMSAIGIKVANAPTFPELWKQIEPIMSISL